MSNDTILFLSLTGIQLVIGLLIIIWAFFLKDKEILKIGSTITILCPIAIICAIGLIVVFLVWFLSEGSDYIYYKITKNWND